MKHLVLTTSLSGEKIRPSDALHRFHAAATRDARTYLTDLAPIDCPACGGDSVPAFERDGFGYRECSDCESVFTSPRPTATAVSRFYEDTEAGRLRVEYFQAAGRERMANVVRPRLDWVANYVANSTPDGILMVDLGGAYAGFLAEARKQDVARECHAVDVPGGLRADAQAAGAGVEPEPDPGAADVVTAFEQLEHQASPVAFLSRARAFLKPGGWLFATTRTISGLDLQVLWDRVPYVFVPEHMNLLSVEGLHRILEVTGFEVVELSTPGQLDVELVEQSARDHDVALPRFLRYLFRHRGDQCRSDLQELLQRHRLSSHVRIAARVTDERAHSPIAE